MMNSARVSAPHQQPQQHTSVGGWVAATRPYPLLEEDEEVDAGDEKGEMESEELLSDDGGIDVDEAGGLDNVCLDPQLGISPSSSSTNQKPCFATPRIDSYRFSMATLEDSQDVELDAILGELCALENQFDREIFSGSRNHQRSASSVSQSSGVSSLDSRSNGLQVHHMMASTSTLQSLGAPTFQQSGGGGGGSGTMTPSTSTERFSMHSRSSSTGAPTIRTPKFELLGLGDSVVPVTVAASSSSAVGIEDGNGRAILIGGQKTGELGLRTESPDNDSAFSDTVSMLSSESSASSGGGAVNGVTRVAGPNVAAAAASHAKISNTSPTQLNAEEAARIKAEKIKIALEKIREASIKKLFIKAFTVDGSAKSLLVDEKMTVGFVTKLLVDKNHVNLDLRWSIVEHIPELFMERVFEDHENLVENMMLWTRDSKNKLLFVEKVHKYDLFVRPENYFSLNSGRKYQDFDDDSRQSLIEELFSGNCVSVPEVEGNLYMKSDGKKAWKKHFFVLRASGLYYCPKGKSKLSKDLVCLVTFDMNHLYLAVGWKKKYKAPTEYGFALKHPQIQLKASKYIKYLCAEDECSLRMWTVGIRVAKFGRQLLDNHRTLLQDMAEDDLEALAHARSFSVSSVARGSGVSSQCTTPSAPTTPTYDTLGEPPPRASSSTSGDGSSSNSESHSSSATPVSTLERTWKSRRSMSRHDSVRSSSSGATSERSGNGTPTNGDQPPFGFDCDYPTMGTIKRKPSVNPKIPLTNTTRTLAKQSIDGEITSPDGDELIPRGGGVGNGGGTLRKKRTTTMRRSLTDERISIPELMSTLRRQQSLLRHEIIPSPPASPILLSSPSPSSSSPPRIHRQCDLMDGIFPLPPPPPEFAASMESLLSVDCLPLPPPPDPYKSNLSLDSLPPPPPTPPIERRRSVTSLNPLPLPPPSPLLASSSDAIRNSPSSCVQPPVPPPKPIHRPCAQSDDVHFYDVVTTSPTASSQHVPPPFLAELKAQTMSAPRGGLVEKTKPIAAASQINGHRHLNGHDGASVHQKRLKSPSVCRKITFRDEVSVIGRPGLMITPKAKPPAPPPPPLPNVVALRAAITPDKPAPPRRSENTRLSIGRGSNDSNYSTLALNSQVGKSPKTFLADLQKVMEKKWKVAQQLKVDLNSSPHTVMGFRDPPLPSDVLCCTAHIDEKNRVAAAKAQAAALNAVLASTPSATTPIKMQPTTLSSSSSLSSMQSSVDSCGRTTAVIDPKKKMPPPPPPKRSETTQLTMWAQ